jgi:hypothetical protein
MPTQHEGSSPLERFNALQWHDSKLVGVAFFDSPDGDDQMKLSLEMLDGGGLSSAEIILLGCVYFRCDVNLAAKSMCSDDISFASCYESSEWKDAVSLSSPADPIQGGRGFEGHFHFRVELCPPGGMVDILAKDFVLVYKPEVSPRDRGW